MVAVVATILVVDDEPRIVQLVRDYLEHGGFTVLTASSGPAALRTARTGRPDLVVLDLGLPGLDGLDVARGVAVESYERAIDAHIKNIRRKVGAQYIETVFGVGYRFAEPPEK